MSLAILKKASGIVTIFSVTLFQYNKVHVHICMN